MTSAIVQKQHIDSIFCAVEITRLDTIKHTGTVVFLRACRLKDIFSTADLNRNPAWRVTVNQLDALKFEILMTGNPTECTIAVNKRISQIGYEPECNCAAHQVFSKTPLRIKCSNGEIYPSQAEAARLLGVPQTYISKVLRGTLRQAKGYTFAYIDDKDQPMPDKYETTMINPLPTPPADMPRRNGTNPLTHPFLFEDWLSFNPSFIPDGYVMRRKCITEPGGPTLEQKAAYDAQNAIFNAMDDAGRSAPPAAPVAPAVSPATHPHLYPQAVHDMLENQRLAKINPYDIVLPPASEWPIPHPPVQGDPYDVPLMTETNFDHIPSGIAGTSGPMPITSVTPGYPTGPAYDPAELICNNPVAKKYTVVERGTPDWIKVYGANPAYWPIEG